MRPFILPRLSSQERYVLVEDESMDAHLEAMGFPRQGRSFRVDLDEGSMEALRNTSLQGSLLDALSALEAETPPTLFRDMCMDYRSPKVMGVLNVTPDSFSDGGRFLDHRRAVDRGLEMAEQGADMIDVGGESTRPCAQYVDPRTEMERILPVVEALSASLDIPVSVDTRKPVVAEKAIDRGARMINDVSGLREEGMMQLVAGTGVAAVIMHMRGTPRDMQDDTGYGDVVHEVMRYLHRRREELMDLGASRSQVILDPGLGFGKSPVHNLELIKALPTMRSLGSPLLVGASRKSFLGRILQAETHERLEGSLAAASVSVAYGADIIRAHDVAETVKAVEVAAALRPVRG